MFYQVCLHKVMVKLFNNDKFATLKFPLQSILRVVMHCILVLFYNYADIATNLILIYNLEILKLMVLDNFLFLLTA